MAVKRFSVLPFCFLLGLTTTGCGSGSSSIARPAVDPEAAAQAAIQLYDKDGDGSLNEEELSACPGMYQHRRAYDQNNDGVSAEEIADRLRQIYGGTVPSLVNVRCTVLDRGRPVQWSSVHFIPEPFLSDFILPAEGETDHRGRTTVAIPDDKLPESDRGLNAMQTGIYRIEIESESGQSTDHLYGWEVSPLTRGGYEPLIELSK